MKSARILLFCLTLLAILSAAAGAQTDAKGTFDNLKKLEGAWEGTLTTDPPVPDIKPGTSAKVWLRVASMGNVLLHDVKIEGRPDNPLTMFYLDEGRLLLTHYCDAGNRPRMVAQPATDANKVTFDFLDVSGPLKYGHMHDAAITVIDADRHVEEWAFHLPGDKHVRARFDLRRVK